MLQVYRCNNRYRSFDILICLYIPFNTACVASQKDDGFLPPGNCCPILEKQGKKLDKTTADNLVWRNLGHATRFDREEQVQLSFPRPLSSIQKALRSFNSLNLAAGLHCPNQSYSFHRDKTPDFSLIQLLICHLLFFISIQKY